MTTRPRVVVVFTGGTISMLPDPVSGAAVPMLRGAAILERTPGLADIADVEAVDWGLVPASHLGFPQILDIAGVLRTALARPGVAGAVVVQGTDVMEETAFAWDLLVPGPAPVVVVGAMRNAGDPGYEGPANLRDAVQAAADPALREQGTVVVMGGAILAARDVVKTDTDRYETFQAPGAGASGDVRAGAVHVARQRTHRRLLEPVPVTVPEPVHLIPATVAAHPGLLRAAIDDGARGLVIAATGAGNTHPVLLDEARRAMAAGIPVVLATRCVSGRVSPAYGFPGGGRQWIDGGAIPAGPLNGPKARIALALGLGAGLDMAGLGALFADLGR